MKRSGAFYAGLLLAQLLLRSGTAQVIRDGDCVVDAEILSLPTCALESNNGSLYVKRKFLPLFFADKSQHLAWRSLPADGWAYFDRKGLVLVKNVATMDNGPDEIHQGLVRVTRNGKWGLANLHGSFVVPFTYDGMLGYEPGHGWRACSGCRTVRDGEYSFFQGGTWIQLNRSGKVAGPAKEPQSPPDE